MYLDYPKPRHWRPASIDLGRPTRVHRHCRCCHCLPETETQYTGPVVLVRPIVNFHKCLEQPAPNLVKDSNRDRPMRAVATRRRFGHNPTQRHVPECDHKTERNYYARLTRMTRNRPTRDRRVHWESNVECFVQVPRLPSLH